SIFQMGDQWAPSIWSASSLHLPSSLVAPLMPTVYSGPPPTGGDLIKLEKAEAPETHQMYGAEGYPGGEAAPGTGYDPSFFGSTMYPSGVGAHPGSSTEMDETIKQQKAAIFSHPLFPLLTCLFEKCELATCTPRDSVREGANDVVSAASFNEDLDQFKKTMETQKAYYTPNKLVDDYMIEYIAMLRFHLMEVEKVHELCDNFCQRYVSCLKGKMPMDIVGEERASSSQMSPGGSPGMNTPMNHYQAPSAPPYEPQTVPLPESTMPHGLESLQGLPPSSYGLTPLGGLDPSSSSSSMLPLAMDGPMLAATGHTSHSSTQAAPLGTNMGPSLHPLHPAPSPSASSSGGARNGSTPLYDSSMINLNPASIDSTETDSMEYYPSSSSLYPPLSLSSSSPSCHHHYATPSHPTDPHSNLPPDSPSESDRSSANKKRGIFPKTATNVMRNWLFKHLTHPYPSEEQKKQLANETGLTILQVNNWFINARRRIVQPMIDQSNRAGRGAPMTAFRGRRRDRESSSGTPEAQTTPINGNDSIPSTYSPDVSSSVAPMVYPSSDLSYMGRSLPFPYTSSFNPSMPSPFMIPPMFAPSAPLPWPMDALQPANITQME
ncbi:hypothetical protein PFISCL1PPCAC_2538, partial [Pristionchus fissidentatus]